MKLLYKQDVNEPINSFLVHRVKEPVLDINWHFHEEYEIIYIIKGQGIRLVGDNLSGFYSGELVLVGPNLPHLWRTTGNISAVDRIIIKFSERPGNIDIFELPELAQLKKFFRNAEMGVSFGSDTVKKVHHSITKLSTSTGMEKWINFLEVLNIISNSSDYKTISNPLSLPKVEENRLSKVISFVSDNFTRDISLEEVSDIASMTPQSFCRFFKKRTNKTFVQFLNEYRVGKARVMLTDNKLPVSQICYDLGFNSLTNFNRMFKKRYNCTPVEYRKKYKNI